MINQITKKIWFKLVAAVLCVVIPATEIGPAYASISPEIVGTGSSSSPIAESGPEISHLLSVDHALQPQQISIPSEIGSIQEIFRGRGNSTVVHIQDAHGSISAQGNIAKLVKYLHENYGISLLTVEGAAGEVDLKGVRDFPDAAVREKVARRYLQSFDLTGDEYYLISENPSITMYGVERMLKYYFNRDQFFRAKKLSEKLSPVLNRFSIVIRSLEKEMYSKELLTLMKNIDRARLHHEFLLTHIKYLSEHIENFASLYPQLNALRISEPVGTDLDLFMSELQSAEKTLKNSLLRSDAEKHLAEFTVLVALLQKLLTLTLSSEEFGELKAHTAKWNADYFRTEFESFSKRPLWKTEFKQLFKFSGAFLEFYKSAGARDEIFARNTAKALQKKNARNAILITGGFHTTGLTNIWRKNNVSFAVIRPNVDEPNEKELAKYQNHAMRRTALSKIVVAERGFGISVPWRMELRDRMMADMRRELITSKAIGFGASQEGGTEMNKQPDRAAGDNTEKPLSRPGRVHTMGPALRGIFSAIFLSRKAFYLSGALALLLPLMLWEQRLEQNSTDEPDWFLPHQRAQFVFGMLGWTWFFGRAIHGLKENFKLARATLRFTILPFLFILLTDVLMKAGVAWMLPQLGGIVESQQEKIKHAVHVKSRLYESLYPYGDYSDLLPPLVQNFLFDINLFLREVRSLFDMDSGFLIADYRHIIPDFPPPFTGRFWEWLLFAFSATLLGNSFFRAAVLVWLSGWLIRYADDLIFGSTIDWFITATSLPSEMSHQHAQDLADVALRFGYYAFHFGFYMAIATLLAKFFLWIYDLGKAEGPQIKVSELHRSKPRFFEKHIYLPTAKVIANTFRYVRQKPPVELIFDGAAPETEKVPKKTSGFGVSEQENEHRQKIKALHINIANTLRNGSALFKKLENQEKIAPLFDDQTKGAFENEFGDFWKRIKQLNDEAEGLEIADDEREGLFQSTRALADKIEAKLWAHEGPKPYFKDIRPLRRAVHPEQIDEAYYSLRERLMLKALWRDSLFLTGFSLLMGFLLLRFVGQIEIPLFLYALTFGWSLFRLYRFVRDQLWPQAHYVIDVKPFKGGEDKYADPQIVLRRIAFSSSEPQDILAAVRDPKDYKKVAEYLEERLGTSDRYSRLYLTKMKYSQRIGYALSRIWATPYVGKMALGIAYLLLGLSVLAINYITNVGLEYHPSGLTYALPSDIVEALNPFGFLGLALGVIAFRWYKYRKENISHPDRRRKPRGIAPVKTKPWFYAAALSAGFTILASSAFWLKPLGRRFTAETTRLVLKIPFLRSNAKLTEEFLIYIRSQYGQSETLQGGLNEDVRDIYDEYGAEWIPGLSGFHKTGSDAFFNALDFEDLFENRPDRRQELFDSLAARISWAADSALKWHVSTHEEWIEKSEQTGQFKIYDLRAILGYLPKLEFALDSINRNWNEWGKSFFDRVNFVSPKLVQKALQGILNPDSEDLIFTNGQFRSFPDEIRQKTEAIQRKFEALQKKLGRVPAGFGTAPADHRGGGSAIAMELITQFDRVLLAMGEVPFSKMTLAERKHLYSKYVIRERTTLTSEPERLLDLLTSYLLEHEEELSQVDSRLIRDVLVAVNEILKDMRVAGYERAGTLPETDDWLVYQLTGFYHDEEQLMRRARALAKVTPTGAALFFSMLGAHLREDFFQSDLVIHGIDLQMYSILMSAFLPRLKTILEKIRTGEATSGEIEGARFFAGALVGGLIVWIVADEKKMAADTILYSHFFRVWETDLAARGITGFRELARLAITRFFGEKIPEFAQFRNERRGFDEIEQLNEFNMLRKSMSPPITARDVFGGSGRGRDYRLLKTKQFLDERHARGVSVPTAYELQLVYDFLRSGFGAEEPQSVPASTEGVPDRDFRAAYEAVRRDGEFPFANELAQVLNIPAPMIRRTGRRLGLAFKDQPYASTSPLARYAQGYTDDVPPPTAVRLHRTRTGTPGFVISTIYVAGLPNSVGKPGDEAKVSFRRAGKDTRDLIVSVWPESSDIRMEKPHMERRIIVAGDGSFKVERKQPAKKIPTSSSPRIKSKRAKGTPKESKPSTRSTPEAEKKKILRPVLAEFRRARLERKYPGATSVWEALDAWRDFARTFSGKASDQKILEDIRAHYMSYLSALEKFLHSKYHAVEVLHEIQKQFLDAYYESRQLLSKGGKIMLDRMAFENRGVQALIVGHDRLLKYLVSLSGADISRGHLVNAGKISSKLAGLIKAYAENKEAGILVLRNLRQYLLATVSTANEHLGQNTAGRLIHGPIAPVFQAYDAKFRETVAAEPTESGKSNSELDTLAIFEKHLEALRREMKKNTEFLESPVQAMEQTRHEIDSFLAMGKGRLDDFLRLTAKLFLTLEIFAVSDSFDIRKAVDIRTQFFLDTLPFVIRFFPSDEEFDRFETGDADHDGLFMRMEDILDQKQTAPKKLKGSQRPPSGFGASKDFKALSVKWILRGLLTVAFAWSYSPIISSLLIRLLMGGALGIFIDNIFTIYKDKLSSKRLEVSAWRVVQGFAMILFPTILVTLFLSSWLSAYLQLKLFSYVGFSFATLTLFVASILPLTSLILQFLRNPYEGNRYPWPVAARVIRVFFWVMFAVSNGEPFSILLSNHFSFLLPANSLVPIGYAISGVFSFYLIKYVAHYIYRFFYKPFKVSPVILMLVVAIGMPLAILIELGAAAAEPESFQHLQIPDQVDMSLEQADFWLRFIMYSIDLYIFPVLISLPAIAYLTVNRFRQLLAPNHQARLRLFQAETLDSKVGTVLPDRLESMGWKKISAEDARDLLAYLIQMSFSMEEVEHKFQLLGLLDELPRTREEASAFYDSVIAIWQSSEISQRASYPFSTKGDRDSPVSVVDLGDFKIYFHGLWHTASYEEEVKNLVKEIEQKGEALYWEQDLKALYRGADYGRDLRDQSVLTFGLMRRYSVLNQVRIFFVSFVELATDIVGGAILSLPDAIYFLLTGKEFRGFNMFTEKGKDSLASIWMGYLANEYPQPIEWLMPKYVDRNGLYSWLMILRSTAMIDFMIKDARVKGLSAVHWIGGLAHQSQGIWMALHPEEMARFIKKPDDYYPRPAIDETRVKSEIAGWIKNHVDDPLTYNVVVDIDALSEGVLQYDESAGKWSRIPERDGEINSIRVGGVERLKEQILRMTGPEGNLQNLKLFLTGQKPPASHKALKSFVGYVDLPQEIIQIIPFEELKSFDSASQSSDASAIFRDIKHLISKRSGAAEKNLAWGAVLPMHDAKTAEAISADYDAVYLFDPKGEIFSESDLDRPDKRISSGSRLAEFLSAVLVRFKIKKRGATEESVRRLPVSFETLSHQMAYILSVRTDLPSEIRDKFRIVAIPVTERDISDEDRKQILQEMRPSAGFGAARKKEVFKVETPKARRALDSGLLDLEAFPFFDVFRREPYYSFTGSRSIIIEDALNHLDVPIFAKYYYFLEGLVDYAADRWDIKWFYFNLSLSRAGRAELYRRVKFEKENDQHWMVRLLVGSLMFFGELFFLLFAPVVIFGFILLGIAPLIGGATDADFATFRKFFMMPLSIGLFVKFSLPLIIHLFHPRYSRKVEEFILKELLIIPKRLSVMPEEFDTLLHRNWTKYMVLRDIEGQNSFSALNPSLPKQELVYVAGRDKNSDEKKEPETVSEYVLKLLIDAGMDLHLSTSSLSLEDQIKRYAFLARAKARAGAFTSAERDLEEARALIRDGNLSTQEMIESLVHIAEAEKQFLYASEATEQAIAFHETAAGFALNRIISAAAGEERERLRQNAERLRISIQPGASIANLLAELVIHQPYGPYYKALDFAEGYIRNGEYEKAEALIWNVEGYEDSVLMRLALSHELAEHMDRAALKRRAILEWSPDKDRFPKFKGPTQFSGDHILLYAPEMDDEEKQIVFRGLRAALLSGSSDIAQNAWAFVRTHWLDLPEWLRGVVDENVFYKVFTHRDEKIKNSAGSLLLLLPNPSLIAAFEKSVTKILSTKEKASSFIWPFFMIYHDVLSEQVQIEILKDTLTNGDPTGVWFVVSKRSEEFSEPVLAFLRAHIVRLAESGRFEDVLKAAQADALGVLFPLFKNLHRSKIVSILSLRPEWISTPSGKEEFDALTKRLLWLPPLGGKYPVIFKEDGTADEDIRRTLPPLLTAEEQAYGILSLEKEGKLGEGFVHQLAVQGKLPDEFKYVAIALILTSPFPNDWNDPFFKAAWGQVAPLIHDGGAVDYAINPLWKNVLGRSDFLQRIQGTKAQSEHKRVLLEARAYQRLALALHAHLGTAPAEIPQEIRDQLSAKWVKFRGRMEGLLINSGARGVIDVPWFYEEGRKVHGWPEKRFEGDWPAIRSELEKLEDVRKENPQLRKIARKILQNFTEAIDEDLGLSLSSSAGFGTVPTDRRGGGMKGSSQEGDLNDVSASETGRSDTSYLRRVLKVLLQLLRPFVQSSFSSVQSNHPSINVAYMNVHTVILSLISNWTKKLAAKRLANMTLAQSIKVFATRFLLPWLNRFMGIFPVWNLISLWRGIERVAGNSRIVNNNLIINNTPSSVPAGFGAALINPAGETEDRQSRAEISETKKMLAELLAMPPEFDWEAAFKQGKLPDLDGRSLGKTDTRGGIPLYPVKSYLYSWKVLGGVKEGWHVAIEKGYAKDSWYHLDILLTKEKEAPIRRTFQLGRFTRTIRSISNPRDTRRVLEIHEQLGLRPLAELVATEDSEAFKTYAKSLPNLAGLRLGKTNKHGVISFAPFEKYTYPWNILGSVEEGWEATITESRFEKDLFNFSVAFTKEDKKTTRRFQIGAFHASLLGKSEAERKKVRAIDEALGSRPLKELLTRMDDEDFDTYAKVLPNLSGYRLGVTNVSGAINIRLAQHHHFHWRVLGVRGKGWEAVIEDSHYENGIFRLAVRLTRGKGENILRIFQIGHVHQTIAGQASKKGTSIRVRALSDRLGLVPIAEMMRQETIEGFQAVAQTIPNLIGLELGTTNADGEINFSPAQLFLFSWGVLGYRDSGWRASVAESHYLDGIFHLAVRLRKKGRTSILKRFQLGHFTTDLVSQGSRRGRRRRFFDLNDRLGLTPVAELLRRTDPVQFSKYARELPNLKKLRLGLTGDNGSLQVVIQPYFYAQWRILGRKSNESWEAYITDSGFENGFYRLSVVLTQKGHKDIHRTFHIAPLPREIVSAVDKRKRIFANKISARMGKEYITKLVTFTDPKAFASFAKNVPDLGGLRIGITNADGGIPFTPRSQYHVNWFPIGWKKAGWEGVIVRSGWIDGYFRFLAKFTKGDRPPVYRFFQIGPYLRDVRLVWNSAYPGLPSTIVILNILNIGRIARLAGKEEIRKRKRLVNQDTPLGYDVVRHASTSVLGRVMRREFFERLNGVLENFVEGDRPIAAQILSGGSDLAIATELGAGIEDVKRVRARLQKELRSFLDEDTNTLTAGFGAANFKHRKVNHEARAANLKRIVERLKRKGEVYIEDLVEPSGFSLAVLAKMRPQLYAWGVSKGGSVHGPLNKFRVWVKRLSFEGKVALISFILFLRDERKITFSQAYALVHMIFYAGTPLDNHKEIAKALGLGGDTEVSRMLHRRADYIKERKGVLSLIDDQPELKIFLDRRARLDDKTVIKLGRKLLVRAHELPSFPIKLKEDGEELIASELSIPQRIAVVAALFGGKTHEEISHELPSIAGDLRIQPVSASTAGNFLSGYDSRARELTGALPVLTGELKSDNIEIGTTNAEKNLLRRFDETSDIYKIAARRIMLLANREVSVTPAEIISDMKILERERTPLGQFVRALNKYFSEKNYPFDLTVSFFAAIQGDSEITDRHLAEEIATYFSSYVMTQTSIEQFMDGLLYMLQPARTHYYFTLDETARFFANVYLQLERPPDYRLAWGRLLARFAQTQGIFPERRHFAKQVYARFVSLVFPKAVFMTAEEIAQMPGSKKRAKTVIEKDRLYDFEYITKKSDELRQKIDQVEHLVDEFLKKTSFKAAAKRWKIPEEDEDLVYKAVLEAAWDYDLNRREGAQFHSFATKYIITEARERAYRKRNIKKEQQVQFALDEDGRAIALEETPAAGKSPLRILLDSEKNSHRMEELKRVLAENFSPYEELIFKLANGIDEEYGIPLTNDQIAEVLWERSMSGAEEPVSHQAVQKSLVRITDKLIRLLNEPSLADLGAWESALKDSSKMAEYPNPIRVDVSEGTIPLPIRLDIKLTGYEIPDKRPVTVSFERSASSATEVRAHYVILGVSYRGKMAGASVLKLDKSGVVLEQQRKDSREDAVRFLNLIIKAERYESESSGNAESRSGFGASKDQHEFTPPYVDSESFRANMELLRERFFGRLTRTSRVLIFSDNDGDGIASAGLLKALIVGLGKVREEKIHLFMEGEFNLKEVLSAGPGLADTFIIFADINGALARYQKEVPPATRRKVSGVLSIDHHSVEKQMREAFFVHPESTWRSALDSFYFPTTLQAFYIALALFGKHRDGRLAARFYEKYIPLAVFALRHDIALFEQIGEVKAWRDLAHSVVSEEKFITPADIAAVDHLLRLDRLIQPRTDENRFVLWLKPLLENLSRSFSELEIKKAYQTAFSRIETHFGAYKNDVEILRAFVSTKIKEALGTVSGDEEIAFVVVSKTDFAPSDLSPDVIPRVRVDLAGNLASRLGKDKKKAKPSAVVVFEQDFKKPDFYRLRFRAVRNRISVGDLIARAGLGRQGRIEKANARLTLGLTKNPRTGLAYRSLDEVKNSILAEARKMRSGFGVENSGLKSLGGNINKGRINASVFSSGAYPTNQASLRSQLLQEPQLKDHTTAKLQSQAPPRSIRINKHKKNVTDYKKYNAQNKQRQPEISSEQISGKKSRHIDTDRAQIEHGQEGKGVLSKSQQKYDLNKNPSGFGAGGWRSEDLKNWLITANLPEGKSAAMHTDYELHVDAILEILNRIEVDGKREGKDKKKTRLTPHFKTLGVGQPGKLIGQLLNASPPLRIDARLGTYVPGTDVFLVSDAVMHASYLTDHFDFRKHFKQSMGKEILWDKWVAQAKAKNPDAFANLIGSPADLGNLFYEALLGVSDVLSPADATWFREHRDDVRDDLREMGKAGRIWLSSSRMSTDSDDVIRQVLAHEFLHDEIRKYSKSLPTAKHKIFHANLNRMMEKMRDNVDKFFKDSQREEFDHPHVSAYVRFQELIASSLFPSIWKTGLSGEGKYTLLEGLSEEDEDIEKVKRKIRDNMTAREGFLQLFPFIRPLFNQALSRANDTVPKVRKALSATPSQFPPASQGERFGFGAETLSNDTIVRAIKLLSEEGIPLNSGTIQKDVTEATSRILKVHLGFDLTGRELFSAAIYKGHFGSWDRALQAAGLDSMSVRKYFSWSRSRIVEAIQILYENGIPLNEGFIQHDISDRTREVLRKRFGKDVTGEALYGAATRFFNPWDQALEAAGLDPAEVRLRMSWTPQSVVRGIQILHENNVALNAKAISRDQSETTKLIMKKYFGMELTGTALFLAARGFFEDWDTALIAAGFDPMTIRKIMAWPREHIVQAIKLLHRKKVPLNAGSLARDRSEKTRAILKKLFRQKITGVAVFYAVVQSSDFYSWDEALRASGLNPMEIRKRSWGLEDLEILPGQLEVLNREEGTIKTWLGKPGMSPLRPAELKELSDVLANVVAKFPEEEKPLTEEILRKIVSQKGLTTRAGLIKSLGRKFSKEYVNQILQKLRADKQLASYLLGMESHQAAGFGIANVADLYETVFVSGEQYRSWFDEAVMKEEFPFRASERLRIIVIDKNAEAAEVTAKKLLRYLKIKPNQIYAGSELNSISADWLRYGEIYAFADKRDIPAQFHANVIENNQAWVDFLIYLAVSKLVAKAA